MRCVFGCEHPVSRNRDVLPVSYILCYFVLAWGVHIVFNFECVATAGQPHRRRQAEEPIGRYVRDVEIAKIQLFEYLSVPMTQHDGCTGLHEVFASERKPAVPPWKRLPCASCTT